MAILQQIYNVNNSPKTNIIYSGLTINNIKTTEIKERLDINITSLWNQQYPAVQWTQKSDITHLSLYTGEPPSMLASVRFVL